MGLFRLYGRAELSWEEIGKIGLKSAKNFVKGMFCDENGLSLTRTLTTAGTIAGFASTEEGEVKFSGIAPDAQILAMKVFPDADGGAQEGVLINALEDSLRLGADMINLSLGFSLDLRMTNNLLSLSNNGMLYPKVKRDALLIYCIENHKSVYETNECLMEYRLELLD